VFHRVDKIIGLRFPPYTVRLFTSTVLHLMIGKTKKLKNIEFLMPTSLPPRPTGPPAYASVRATSKWSGKWLLLAIAVAVAGALTKWTKNAKKLKK
jgi:hypothetical protein